LIIILQMSDQFLELQPALVLKFMKKILKDDQYVISSNLKLKFSRTLTIFLHYAMSIASQISKEKHRSTVTIEDLKKAFEETGWDEEILEALDNRVLGLGLESTKSRKNPKENAEENNNKNKNSEENPNGFNEIEEEIKSDKEEKEIEEKDESEEKKEKEEIKEIEEIEVEEIEEIEEKEEKKIKEDLF